MTCFLLALLVPPTLTGCSAGKPSATWTHSPTGAPEKARGAQNLVITDGVRGSLVAAAARAKGNLSPSAFAGLEKGHTYYARDLDTGAHWAGATLVPSPGSTAAQVAVQDNGSYDLFMRPRGGKWRVYEVGLAGVAGTRCPVQVPAAVLKLWDWPAHGCHPPRS
jgi:hypothetical protein